MYVGGKELSYELAGEIGGGYPMWVGFVCEFDGDIWLKLMVVARFESGTMWNIWNVDG